MSCRMQVGDEGVTPSIEPRNGSINPGRISADPALLITNSCALAGYSRVSMSRTGSTPVSAEGEEPLIREEGISFPLGRRYPAPIPCGPSRCDASVHHSPWASPPVASLPGFSRYGTVGILVAPSQTFFRVQVPASLPSGRFCCPSFPPPAATSSMMKTVTPDDLTQTARSLGLLRLAVPTFRPQPRDPPAGRFVSRLSAGGCSRLRHPSAGSPPDPAETGSSSYGLPVHLRLLSSTHRCDAVTFYYWAATNPDTDLRRQTTRLADHSCRAKARHDGSGKRADPVIRLMTAILRPLGLTGAAAAEGRGDAQGTLRPAERQWRRVARHGERRKRPVAGYRTTGCAWKIQRDLWEARQRAPAINQSQAIRQRLRPSPSSRIGGFFECALVVDQRVNRKGLHYRGILDIAPMTILAGSRGAVRVRTLAARS